MNTSYPVRSGADCSYGFSPAAMRRAMVVTLASSIACPCSTRCSPARTAASKPDAALALAMTRNVVLRVLASMRSMAILSLSGKSSRMVESVHAWVLRLNAGRSVAGLRTVAGESPYTRGSLAQVRPSWVRIVTSNARRPTSRVQPRHEGPAR